MASYSNIVLIALFFLIATAPRTHGTVTDNVAQVKVSGFLSCAVPGTPQNSNSPPLRGVSVNITCNDRTNNGSTIIVGQVITDKAGNLNATFNLPNGLDIDINHLTCMGMVNLSSITNCKLFPLTGILRLTFVLVRIVDGVAQFLIGSICI